jgi:hypothetical protein
MTDSLPALIASDCLGRTCLHWQPDGELSALDLCLVLDRLALVDAQVLALVESSSAPQPTLSPTSSPAGTSP